MDESLGGSGKASDQKSTLGFVLVGSGELGRWEGQIKISRLGKTRDYREIGAPCTTSDQEKAKRRVLVGSFWSRALLVGSGYQDFRRLPRPPHGPLGLCLAARWLKAFGAG